MNKLSGWTKSYREEMNFFECPDCRRLYDSVPADRWKCYKCEKDFEKHEIQWKPKSVRVLDCRDCGSPVPLLPSSMSLLGYLCADLKCQNLVAVVYGGRTYHPRTVLRVSWNRELAPRGISVIGGARFAEAQNEKDMLLVHLMQMIANQEGESFNYAVRREQSDAVFFDPESNEYIGYIQWNKAEDAECMVLRQIFTMPGQRCKGYGTALLKFWVENYADKIGETFCVESPNDRSQRMLVELGYAKRVNGEVIGIKCGFLSSY